MVELQLCTTLFTYHWVKLMWEQPFGLRMVWKLEDVSNAHMQHTCFFFGGGGPPLCLCYVIFIFFPRVTEMCIGA
jgi:hypothetical protein